MNKRKIVVGENFLHTHATTSGTITSGHVVVDFYDWKAVVDFFTDRSAVTQALEESISGDKFDRDMEQPIGESQKCDQSALITGERETQNLIDIRKFALEQARFILTQNGKYAEGGTVMLLAKDIFDFIAKGS